MEKRGSLAVAFILQVGVIAVLILLFVWAESELLQLIFFSLAVAFALVSSILILSIYFSSVNRLRRKLREVEPLLLKETTEVLKEYYKEIYDLYLKISQRKKLNFFASVTKVRTRIEEMLKAEKKLESLLVKAREGGLSERMKKYHQVEDNFQRLNEKMKERYHTSVIHLKEQLERGK